MLDAEKVKSFWNTRSQKLGTLPFESIVNLEEKEDLLQLKIKLEQEKIMPLLPLNKKVDLLDLGAGVGQWTFRFSPFINHVTAVEYIESLVEIGRREAEKRNISNVEFIAMPAENYQYIDKQFDIIFISGLFVYLNPVQAQQLMDNLKQLIKKDGLILLRDGTSILPTPHYINNQYSSILNENYSAFYRTRDQYIAMFTECEFNLLQDGQVFEEGCPLNKFNETRLWYYLFQPRGCDKC